MKGAVFWKRATKWLTREIIHESGKPIEAKHHQSRQCNSKNHVLRQIWLYLKTPWSWISGTWKIVAATIAAFASLYGILPHMTVDAALNLDPNDPFGTQFTVTNIGRFPAYDVEFSCIINSLNFRNMVSKGNGSDQRSIAELQAGQKVTRGCGAQARGLPILATVDFQVEYRWPLAWWKTNNRAHFSNRRLANGQVGMVPDTD